METKQRLLDSTIKFIAQNGYNSITNKKITEFAQVNSASINYYFNSQERLINQALRTAINNALEPIEFYLDPIRVKRNNNLGKAIATYFTHVMEDKLLISAVLVDPANDIAFKDKAIKRYSSVLFKISQGMDVTDSGGGKRDTECLFYQLLGVSLSAFFIKNESGINVEKFFKENSNQFNIEEKLKYFLRNLSTYQ